MDRSDEPSQSPRLPWARLAFPLLVLAVGLLLVALPAAGEAQTVEVEWVSTMAWPSDLLDVAITNDYAYVAATSGLLVLNISDPENPSEVGFLNLPEESLVVEVVGNYAYVAGGEYTGTLWVVDVSNATNPQEVGSYSLPSAPSDVTTEGNYTYVAGGYSGLRIINISEQTDPIEVGFYDASIVASGVAVVDSYAYLADYSSGLRVIDISDPTSPSEVGNYTIPAARNVAVSGNYAYITGGFFDGVLLVIDISDPKNLFEVGSFNTNGYQAKGLVVTGNYSYVADNYGLRIINIADPTNLTEVGKYRTIYHTNGLAVFEDYAYLVEGVGGLEVINITDPTNLTKASSHSTRVKAAGVEVAGNYVYMPSKVGGLRVIDISDPTVPQEVGEYNNYAGHVEVEGNYAYLAGGSNSFRVIDVSDPTAPQEVGRAEPVIYGGDLAVAGDYAYLIGSTGDLWFVALYVINISDPTNPNEVGRLEYPGDYFSIAIAGHYAYVADLGSGLLVIDISDPVNPKQVRSFDIPGAARDIVVDGNYVYVADSSSGLQIIDISDPSQPNITSSYDTPSQAVAVAVEGGYAFVGVKSRRQTGLVVIDISDPTNPLEIGSYDIPVTTKGVTVASNYIFVVDGDTQLQTLYFNQRRPIANIESIFPSPATAGENITFNGTGSDPDGNLTAFEWRSSIDGVFGHDATVTVNNLSAGNHTISLRVRDDAGAWSEAAQANLTVEAAGGGGDGGRGSLPAPSAFDSRTLVAIAAAGSFAALGGLGYGYHTSGESGRYRLWAMLAPLMAWRRRERRGDDPLANEIRGLIRGYLLAHPGAHFSLLREELGLVNGTLAYHLNVLEREGLVESHRRGRRRCFFPRGKGAPDLAAAEPPGTGEAPLSEIRQKILALVAERPGVSQKELAAALGVTGAAVKYHIDALQAAGRLRRKRRGMRVAYYPE